MATKPKLSKVMLSTAEVISILRDLNPLKIGKDANPLIPLEAQFTFTGRKAQGANGTERVYWAEFATQTEADKKANPNMKPSRYIRITKTVHAPQITSPTQVLKKGFKRPIVETMFEGENTEIFGELMRLLNYKDPETKLNPFIVDIEPDGAGNPRKKLTNPISGAFVTLMVPDHYTLKRNENGTKEFSEFSRKDLLTGVYEPAEYTTINTMKMFVLEEDFGDFEAMAIRKFKREVMRLLVNEELVATMIHNVKVSEEKRASSAFEEDKIEGGEVKPLATKKEEPVNEDTDPSTGKPWGEG
jgi:hypothetical protein